MPGPVQPNCRPPWCVVDDRRNTVDVWYDELVDRFGCDEAVLTSPTLAGGLRRGELHRVEDV